MRKIWITRRGTTRFPQLINPFAHASDNMCKTVRRTCLTATTTPLLYRYGHYDQCIPRPDLYNILLSQIPKGRLRLGKRVVNFTNVQRHSHISQSSSSTSSVKQKSTSSINVDSNSYSDPTESDKIMVRCSDGTFFYGDILVGADGASSAVRQSLYRQLKKAGTLPKADQEEQQYRQVSLVGVTNSLNPRRYPNLNKEFSHFKVVLNKNSPFMVSNWGTNLWL